MEVDAGIALGGEVEEVVGGPERGGEDVGDAGLAAAIAGVAFGHAIRDGVMLACAEAGGGGADVVRELGDLGAGCEDAVDGHLGLEGGPPM